MFEEEWGPSGFFRGTGGVQAGVPGSTPPAHPLDLVWKTRQPQSCVVVPRVPQAKIRRQAEPRPANG